MTFMIDMCVTILACMVDTRLVLLARNLKTIRELDGLGDNLLRNNVCRDNDLFVLLVVYISVILSWTYVPIIKFYHDDSDTDEVVLPLRIKGTLRLLDITRLLLLYKLI